MPDTTNVRSAARRALFAHRRARRPLPACLLNNGRGEGHCHRRETAGVHPPSTPELAAKFPQLKFSNSSARAHGRGLQGAAKQLDRIVALKFFRLASAMTLPLQNVRPPEAKALAITKSPNIVTLYEFAMRRTVYFLWNS